MKSTEPFEPSGIAPPSAFRGAGNFPKDRVRVEPAIHGRLIELGSGAALVDRATVRRRRKAALIGVLLVGLAALAVCGSALVTSSGRIGARSASLLPEILVDLPV